jgi:hypothetical protein
MNVFAGLRERERAARKEEQSNECERKILNSILLLSLT